MYTTKDGHFLDGGIRLLFVDGGNELKDIALKDRTPAATRTAMKSSYGRKNAGGTARAVAFDDPLQKGLIPDVSEDGAVASRSWYRKDTNPDGIKTVVLRFETWFWCEKGEDAGKFYEGVRWEYRMTWDKVEDSVKQLTPAPKEPSKGFLEAYEKYLSAVGYEVGKN
jgi:hypothetical protein